MDAADVLALQQPGQQGRAVLDVDEVALLLAVGQARHVGFKQGQPPVLPDLAVGLDHHALHGLKNFRLTTSPCNFSRNSQRSKSCLE